MSSNNFFNFFYNISLYKEHLFCYTTNTPKERNCLYETSLHYYPLGNLHMFVHDSCPRLSFVYKGTPTALRTPGAAFCGLSSLFIIYRIICLSHKRYIFRKGVYHSRDLDQISGADFEALSCDILVANGFEFAENTQASVDFGVDVLARREGITYAIQCKRYDSPVGIDAVQQVYAGRAYYECHVAMVLTNQYFTGSARKLADKIGVVLWDRDMLEELLQ